ncbi:hypothetical protein [Streptodolium elevatio]|uniref:Uncharacterized protein n=1 Tax=Streptodolium elevatio TaxID=3157996 RepID=A0ABV3DJW3_9ACTN
MAAECTRCEDPLWSTPPEERTAAQWDEFDHLNALRVDPWRDRSGEDRYARIAAERRTTTPAAAVRSTT